MKALILVDIQNDFLTGGALAVESGEQVIPVANKLVNQFELVVATKDWHPQNHGSFASSHEGKSPGDVIDLFGIQQLLWPDHCIQGSIGAQFSSDLDLQSITKIFHKGMNPKIDSYSGFFDNDQKSSTGLGDYLNASNVQEVFVMGLATDYCVKFTALDARRLGFKTNLVLEGCRGVNICDTDCENAIEEMKKAGIEILKPETEIAL